jgi:glycosyltransferase domain-containing protein
MGNNAAPLNTIREARELFRSSPKSVLFYADDVNCRLLKLSWGLRRIGWRVGLVYRNASFFDQDRYFDAVFRASGDRQAYDMAVNLEPPLFHVFSGAIDQRTIEFCQNKPGPVVLDLYDLWAEAIMKYAPERFAPTLEAVSLADGLCARDKRFIASKHKDGMAVPRHSILFSDYCWNEGMGGAAPAQKHPGEVHVVSVGALFLDEQVRRATELLTEKRVHFHIYPRWHFDSSIALETLEVSFCEYLEQEKSNPYLHIHRPVPLEQLYRELRGYDFGLIINGFRALGYDPASSMITEDCLATAYAMRTSDYLDAGLPVLINEELSFLSGILKRLGMVVDAHVMLESDCKQLLLARKEAPEAEMTASQARARFSVMHHIGRLDRFYAKVLREGPQLRTPHSLLKRTTPASAPVPAQPATNNEARFAREYRRGAAQDGYTLIIPTYNRPLELAALLRFLRRGEAKFQILVLDSSSRQENRDKNASTIAASGLNVRHLLFDPLIQPFEKMWEGSKQVTTPYCGMCADDDILMPDSIDPIVNFLDVKPDFAAAQGWYYWFSLERETMDLRLVAFSSPSVENDDPLVRLRDVFIDYESPTYAVYRTALFRDIFERIQCMKHVWGHESLGCALLLVYGKVARLPVWYYGRSGGMAIDLGPSHPLDIMVHSIREQFDLYVTSREILLERLQALQPDRFTPEQWGQYLDLIYTMYFSDIYKKHILNSAFELTLAHATNPRKGGLQVNYRLGICQISLAPPPEAQPATTTGAAPAPQPLGLKQRIRQSWLLRPIMEPLLLPLWRTAKRLRNPLRAMSAGAPCVPATASTAGQAAHPQENIRLSRTLLGQKRIYLLGDAFLARIGTCPELKAPQVTERLLAELDSYDLGHK